MAKLLIQSPGFNNQVINLNLGVNRFGRSQGNDFVIEHATVSSKHCEIALGNGEVTVRDCGSTNGTFVNGQRVDAPILVCRRLPRNYSPNFSRVPSTTPIFELESRKFPEVVKHGVPVSAREHDHPRQAWRHWRVARWADGRERRGFDIIDEYRAYASSLSVK